MEVAADHISSIQSLAFVNTGSEMRHLGVADGCSQAQLCGIPSYGRRSGAGLWASRASGVQETGIDNGRQHVAMTLSASAR